MATDMAPGVRRPPAKPLKPKARRLRAIEREQRRLADEVTRLASSIDEALAMKAHNQVLMAQNRRLIGEVETRDRHISFLRGSLGERK